MPKIKLSNDVYDFLKWFTVLLLPASATLYNVLAVKWGLPYADQIPDTILAVQAFLGTVLCISTVNYNKGGGSE